MGSSLGSRIQGVKFCGLSITVWGLESRGKGSGQGSGTFCRSKAPL